MKSASLPLLYCASPSISTVPGLMPRIRSEVAFMWQKPGTPSPPLKFGSVGLQAMSPAAATTGSSLGGTGSSRTSWGGLAPSRLSSVLELVLVVVRAKLTSPLPWTCAVTSTENHVFAEIDPDAPMGAPSAGRLL